MLPNDFHPVVQSWWNSHFGELPPTPAQLDGWRAIRAGEHALIAAPTGSGKTLAAFLTALDQLFREGAERGQLPDEVRVIYVSPLKALSADIHKNLGEPRREMKRIAEALGYPTVRISAAVRSGDTPPSERAAMLRTPPHILVTTPESLYLLLTAERSREMLKTAQVVIVDEIHAVVESRRGAHLALSLERLDHVCGRKLQRIGLSATQKPIELVGEFLVGDQPPPTIVDHTQKREFDLAVEVPRSPLEAVMASEVWVEVHDRLIELITEHKTTIVFVNTRRMAERLAYALSQRIGIDVVGTHHGSLSKEARLDAEEKLRTGRLKVLVATASLELGIDIGHVDLVCQISSPHRIAAFLQRVGRSGHQVGGTPKGRIFPLTRDELVECTAMLEATRRGELDRVLIPEEPLDVLAQQVAAEAAGEEWEACQLFALMRRAYPYRNLARVRFDEIVDMLAQGYTTRRGRRAALLYHDVVNQKIRARKSTRHIAIMSGGAIPEVYDYRVLVEPDDVFIGTVNEDFAIDSHAGSIFQLGNNSWRVIKVQQGILRVADAQGQPPSMPFWVGEAPSRSEEMCVAVSELRTRVAALLPGPDEPRREDEYDAAIALLIEQYQVSRSVAEQIARYIGEGKRALGVVPTVDTLVLERFFDESGGMQLILHAPLGGRVNRAWGLALRKKFCQNFNFELQAAATEEGIILSLGPSHSFPLLDVFRYLNPATVRETLVQAVLDSPIFETRWRWTTTLSLAVPRNRNGRRVPAQVQRMYAEDLLVAVFPDAAACFENIEGEREVPEHPLVDQSVRDCLEDAMDLPRLQQYLQRIHAGEIQMAGRDTPEPSVFSHEIVNSPKYSFLDDAGLEERRTHAVHTRRATEPRSADDLGALDESAIQRVRDEAWPTAGNEDELHDALLLAGFIADYEVRDPVWFALFDSLVLAGRARRYELGGRSIFVAAERVCELAAIIGGSPPHDLPAQLVREWVPEDAAREMVRGRMEVLGPVTVAHLARGFGLKDEALIEGAVLALETEGRILRGRFTKNSSLLAPGASLEWCDRRLLARIHRYTLNRLRAEIEPVAAVDYMRFLLHWQHVIKDEQKQGVEGLAAIVEQLDGFELPAAAWESEVLPARVRHYTPDQLDALCLSGRVAWGRLGPMSGATRAPLRSSPIALMLRQHTHLWRVQHEDSLAELSEAARAVFDVLRAHGASFFHELMSASGLTRLDAELALAELVGAGLITADSFTGLRALLAARRANAGRRASKYAVDAAGRWAPLVNGAIAEDQRIELIARTLLKRYGIVFRALLARESRLPPWRELVQVYRRMEARGEIRGGRFISTFGGEQFALADAVTRLRAVRRLPRAGELITLSGADPLNLVGIVTPDARVPATARNRVLLRDGLAIAALERGELRRLADSELGDDALHTLLTRRVALKSLELKPLQERWLARVRG